jgi:acetyl/propionyl-CoA carboxylase alpha subunit
MLAKIVGHGTDRAEALDRLADALDRTIVLGLTTNLRFLRWLVREPALRDGEMRIDTLDRIWPPDEWASRVAVPARAWGAAAAALAGDGWNGGWRLNAPPRLRLASGDAERTVDLDVVAGEDSPAVALVAGTSPTERVALVDVDGRSVEIRFASAPDVDRAARSAAAAHHEGGPVEISAPMPGAVLAVHVDRGTAVEAGDALVTLEAMKMEHAVVAPLAGRVAELAIRTGDQVARGQLIAIVEP